MRVSDAAFGAVLFLWVVSRFVRFMHRCDERTAAEWRELTRDSSRTIYLALYCALLLQLLCRMLSVSWNSGGVALAWSLPFQAAPQDVVMKCGDGFRGNLVVGVCALLLIRALSAYHRRLLLPIVPGA